MPRQVDEPQPQVRELPVRLVQITANDRGLYALDADGLLWYRFVPGEGEPRWVLYKGPKLKVNAEGKTVNETR